MPETGTGIAASKPTARSRVTNGSALLAGVDGRSRGARRMRDVLDGLLAQLGDAPAEAEIKARRVASLTVWIEGQEALIARSEPVDMAALTTAVNAQRRLLADLGLSRRRGRAA